MPNDPRYVVYAGSDQEFVAKRRSDVRLQGLGTCLGQVAAHDHSDLRDFRTTKECGGLDQGAPDQERLSRRLRNLVPGKEGFCNASLDFLARMDISPTHVVLCIL